MITIPIEFVLIGVGIFSGCIIFLLTYLIVQRNREKQHQAKRAAYLAKVKDAWNAYLFMDTWDPSLLPANSLECLFMEELWLDFLVHFSNEEIVANMSQFANEHLYLYYKRLLYNRKWRHRMRALLRIYDFKIDRLYDACLDVKGRLQDPAEYNQFLRITSLINCRLFFEYFKEMSVHLTEYDLRNMLLTLADDCYVVIKNNYNELDHVVTLCFIDSLGIRGTMEDHVFLESILGEDHDEMRIRALKAINNLGFVTNDATYIPFIHSDVWEERLMVAKVLQHVSLEQAFEHLERLTKDEQFLVRLQACETIKKGKDGTEKLQQIIKTSNDRYAIDAAHEVMLR